MYLRQSNKWKDYLLAEAIENIGLPSRVVTFIRRVAQSTVHGDMHAEKLATQLGVELQKIDEKHLTWLGQLLKKFDMKLFDVTDARNLAHFIKKAVRETSGIDASSSEEEREDLGERIIDAIGPIIDWAMGIQSDSPEDLQTLADMGALRKRMTRALKRAGLSEGEINTAQTIFDHSLLSRITDSGDLRLRLRRIMTVLALDPVYYDEELKSAETFREAYRIAQTFLDNPSKDPDKVIHTFDNGYFWYDIQSHACDFEGKQLGHCGRGEIGQLVSLRSGGGRQMKPMVTLEFDGKVLYQIKGKANQPPKEDLWPYVEWFIENMGVESIKEAPSPMMNHFEEKYPDLDWGNRWAREADELLDQYEEGIETDSQTSLELDYAAEGDDEEVGVILRHQAYWPILDKVIDEDTDRLIWDIIRPEGEVRRIVEDTLYPNPTGLRAAVFRRGEQDSRTAMLRIEMWWSRSFEPADLEQEEAVDRALESLNRFLEELVFISGYLVSIESAPEDANFDYNGFWEGIEDRLKEYGVYRDVAGEIDAGDERDRSPQIELPLQESKRPEPDWFAQQILKREERIIQRWRQIIK